MEEVSFIPLEELFPSSANVRLNVPEEGVRRLAEDIAMRGLLHPLIVRPEGSGYGVVCGRMRLEAIRLLKKERPQDFERLFARGVPCVVKELSDREALEISLSENLRQNTLTPEEVGRGIARLHELGLSEEEISARMQVELDEIKRFVRLYARLRTIAPVVAESKPGRPPRSSQKRKVSRTGITKVVRAVEELAQRGALKNPEEVVKKVADLAAERGLSTSELDILARKIRENPQLAQRPERLIEEISKEEMVERVVLIKRRLANFIDEYARSSGLTFSEALNSILEEYLNLKGAAA
jgi:ParB family chromosome partitioning protein